MPSKEARENYLRKGLCTNCGGNPHREGRVTCSFCAEKSKIKRKINRIKLSQIARIWKDKKRELGLCTNCGKYEACNSIDVYGRKMRTLLCEKCYLKDRAKKYLGDRKEWINLKKLYNRQGGRCAISGMEITIGYNAHIDHIKPRLGRNNGLTNIENLQWVEAIVNLGKDKKTDFNYKEWLSREYKRYFGK